MIVPSPTIETGIRFGIALEHKALRDEIVKRIELRQQIVAVALTLAGVFIGVGLTREAVMLIYPPLAALLALGWGQNDFGIRRAATYICERLEALEESLQYETYMRQQRKKGGLGSWRFIVVSHGGVFFVTQLMAMGVEFSKWPFKPLQWGLLAVDMAAVGVVVWVMKTTFGRATPSADSA